MRAQFVRSPWLKGREIAIAHPVPVTMPSDREHPAPSDDVIIIVARDLDDKLASEIERMVNAHNAFDGALGMLQRMAAQIETAKLSALIKALSGNMT